MEYILFAFASTHHAILAETKLQEKNLDVRIIPLIPEISAGCGFSLKLDEQIMMRMHKKFKKQ